MAVSRREFASFSLAGAMGLGATACGQGEGPRESRSQDGAGSPLDAGQTPAMFAEEPWAELLQTGIEMNGRTRATLRSHDMSADAEPTINFARY